VWVLAALGVAILAAGFGAFARFRDRGTALQAAEAPPATLTVNTQPSGAQVLIDGQAQGTTPVTLSVNPGAHSLALRLNGTERVVPLKIAAGSEVGQYFELTTGGPRSATGRISVVTDPAGARVTVDGVARGASPVTIADLAPAEHRVRVANASGSAERLVAVESGGNTSVVFSLPKKAAGVVVGWLTIAAPFEVQVLERDELIGAGGTTKTKIMLAEGRHDVVLTNGNFGYQESRRIDVASGKVTTITVVPPNAALSVNARPWADVMIDGNEVGQTPISNVRVPIGAHQVIFRHPQFGERRQNIVVTAKGPNRLSVDLTK
jgi:hypothetical protein